MYFWIQPSRFGFTCSNWVWIQGFTHAKPVSYTPSLSPFHPPPWFCGFLYLVCFFYLDFYWECFTKLPGRPKTQDSPSSLHLISHVWLPLSDAFTNVLPLLPAPYIKRRTPLSTRPSSLSKLMESTVPELVGGNIWLASVFLLVFTILCIVSSLPITTIKLREKRREWEVCDTLPRAVYVLRGDMG